MSTQLTEGTRVKVIRFDPDSSINENTTVPSGTQGTVMVTDGAGTIHVRWDNGARIGLIPGIDQFVTLES